MEPRTRKPSLVDGKEALRVLGRFHCQQVLGGRAPFVTYLARTQGLAGFERAFAVKCLSPDAPPAPDVRRVFVDSAQRAAAVRDARLAQVVDAAEIGGVAFAATEYVFGANLGALLELAARAARGDAEPLPASWPRLLAHIGGEIALALGAAHEAPRPIFHGDLAENDVFLSSRGVVKVADFGHHRVALAMLGSAAAAPRHVPPEAAGLGGAEPSAAGDVYALGAMLFALGAGRAPLAGEGASMVTDALAAMGDRFARAVARLLAADPAQRPSAREAASLLRGSIHGLSETERRGQLGALARRATSPGVDPTSPSPVESVILPAKMLAAAAELPALAAERGRKHTASMLGAFAPPVPTPPPVEPRQDAAPRQVIDDVSSAEAPVAAFGSSPIEAMFPAPPADAPIGDEEATRTDLAGGPAVASPGRRAEAVTKPELASFRGARPPAPPKAIAGAPAPPKAIAGAPAPKQRPDLSNVTTGEFEAAFSGLSDDPPAQPADDAMAMLSKFHDFDDEAETGFFRRKGQQAPNAAPEALERAEPSTSAAPASEEATRTDLSPRFEEQTDAERAAPAKPGEPDAEMLSDSAIIPGELETASPDGAPAETATAPQGTDAGPPARRRGVRVALVLVGSAVACAVGLFGGYLVFPRAKPPVPAAAPVAPQPAPKAASVPAAAPAAPAPPAPSAPSPPAAPAEQAEPEAPAAEAAAEPEPPAPGSVTFTTDPPGATIWIGGIERGVTPFSAPVRPLKNKLIAVRAGSATLFAKFDGRAAAGKRWHRKLDPAPAAPTGDARVTVTCRTEGKFPISIDGVETGLVCPAARIGLPPGAHEIAIFVPGRHKSYPVSVKLRAGAEKALSYPK